MGRIGNDLLPAFVGNQQASQLPGLGLLLREQHADGSVVFDLRPRGEASMNIYRYALERWHEGNATDFGIVAVAALVAVWFFKNYCSD